MKRTLFVALALACVLPLFADEAKINTLTDKEKTDGWQLLFNGKDFTGWHNFHMNMIMPGWVIKDGNLVCEDPHHAGDIVTDASYDWFELQLDYNISEAGNSGIMYHVNNDGRAVTLNFIVVKNPDGWVISDVESPHDSLRAFLAQYHN